MGRVYAVGVGPGSPRYVTGMVEDIIRDCDMVAGYRYTMDTIRHLLDGKEIHHVTMSNQEETYQRIRRTMGGKSLVVPFTGDVNFSESEVVDRLIEIFKDVVLVPGISATQVAAARSCIPLDKACTITMHVTGDIEDKKRRMVNALREGLSVILVPRPWPGRPDLNFMPHEISAYLKSEGFDTGALPVHIYENLTTPNERTYAGTARGMADGEFSDMLVVVIGRNKPDSYMNYTWQWSKDHHSQDLP